MTPNAAQLEISAGTLQVKAGGITATELASNAVTTAKIAASTGATDGVTFAKLQHVTDARLLGRSAGSNGVPQELTVGTGLALAAGVLTATASAGFALAGFAQKTETQTVTKAAGWTDIGDLTVTVTPQSSASTFLLFAVVNAACLGSSAGGGAVKFVRGATDLGVATSAGSRVAAGAVTGLGDSDVRGVPSVTLLHHDSPATASAITYKVQLRAQATSIGINRTFQDDDVGGVDGYARSVSSLIVLEIP